MHAFGEKLGDGQAQARRLAGGVHREEAVKELAHVYRGQGSGGIGKGHGAVGGELHRQVAVAVFDGVADDVAENTGECGGVQIAPHTLVGAKDSYKDSTKDCR